MKLRVKLYVVAVIVAGIASSVLVAVDPCGRRNLGPTSILLMVLFAVCALVAELKPIVTPGGNETTVASSVFIAAVLLLGPQWTLPIVAFSLIGSHVISRRPIVRMVFNVAQYALAICVAGLLFYHVIDPACGGREIVWASFDSLAVLVFLLLYFILNSGLVAIVIALDEQRPILPIWFGTIAELLPQYSAMDVVGVMAAMLWAVTPISMLLIGFVVMIIYTSFSLAESLKIAQNALLVRMKQLERRTAELTLLNEVGAALPNLVDLKSFWELLAHRLQELLEFGDLFIALYDPGRGEFQLAFEQVSAPFERDDRDALVRLWRQVVERGHPVTLGPVRGGTDGLGAIQLATVIVPIVVDGRPVGVLCCRTVHADAYSSEDQRVLTAIADQVAVAYETTRLRQQAAEIDAIDQLNQLKTEFISLVSHELRSPLTPIVAYSELLTLRSFPTEVIRQMAAEMHRQTIHLQRLVDDLLDVSRIEAGNLRLDVQPVQLEEIIEPAVREYANSPQHEFEVQLPPTLPAVMGDPTRLRQVITNLLGNAVKYSPDGGRITVAARVDDGIVEIRVSDQGIGIPPDKLDRIFEKFYRIEGDLTRRIRGTGLGLALCKHIVEAHGGRIWAESSGLGQGSSVFVALPVDQLAVVHTEVPSVASP